MRKPAPILIVFLATSVHLLAQTTRPTDLTPPPPPPQPTANEVCYPAIREEGPWFPGCEMFETFAEKKKCSDSLVMEFIYSNLQYPSESRENCIEGVVYVRITIEKDGSVTSPTILRDIGGGCGDEVLRIIKLMPKKWQPGTQLGRPVRVQYNIPVRFKLN